MSQPSFEILPRPAAQREKSAPGLREDETIENLCSAAGCKPTGRSREMTAGANSLGLVGVLGRALECCLAGNCKARS